MFAKEHHLFKIVRITLVILVIHFLAKTWSVQVKVLSVKTWKNVFNLFSQQMTQKMNHSMVKYQSICVDFVNRTKPALKTIGTTVKKSQIFEDSLNTLTEIKSLKIKGKTFFRTFIQRCWTKCILSRFEILGKGQSCLNFVFYLIVLRKPAQDNPIKQK